MLSLKYFFTILAFFSFVSVAEELATQTWRTFTPYEGCSVFQVHILQQTDKYIIRYQSGNEQVQKELLNITDISPFANELQIAAQQVCPELLIFNIEDQRCSLLPTTGFGDVFSEVRDYLNRELNNCEELQTWFEAQEAISQLQINGSDNGLTLNLRESRKLIHNVFKLFVGEELRRYIDLYNRCGGRAQSQEFIKNAIILTAYDQCLFPRPPGMLSLDDVREVANSISSEEEYQNLGLISASGKMPQLTKAGVVGLGEKILKVEAERLLSDFIDEERRNEIIDSLQSLQSLKSKEDWDDVDLTALVTNFQTEATLELAEKAIPEIAKNSIGKQIPEFTNFNGFANSDVFIQEVVEPQVIASYQQCMQSSYDRVLYSENSTDDQKLTRRSELREQYCRQFPEQCPVDSCAGSVNIISGSDDTTDFELIQGCAMGSVLAPIEDMIEINLLHTVQEMNSREGQTQNLINLRGSMLEDFVELSETEFQSCLDSNIAPDRRASGTSVMDDYSDLQRIDTTEFEEIVSVCVERLEPIIARDIFRHTILEQLSAVQTSVDDNIDGELVLVNGVSYASDLVANAESILQVAYDPCLAHLQQASGSNVNVEACMPAAEIEGSRSFVANEINNIFQENSIDSESTQILQEFQTCSHQAMEESYKNPPTEFTGYLDNNPAFYQCVRTAISATSDLVGGKTYDRSVSGIRSNLQDPSITDRIKAPTLSILNQCFERQLNGLENWSAFKEFGTTGGLSSLETSCTEEAIDYALPRVVENEINFQLRPLVRERLITSSEAGGVVPAVAAGLRRRYNLPSNGVYETIAAAYRLHLQRPGNSDQSFIRELSELSTIEATEELHENIISLIRSNLNSREYERVLSAVTPQCMARAYQENESQIRRMISLFPTGTQAGIEEPARYFAEGLIFVRESRGVEALNRITDYFNDICRRCTNRRGCVFVVAEEAQNLRFIAEAMIHETTKNTFMVNIIDQCRDDLNKVNLSSFASEICGSSDPIETPEPSVIRRRRLEIMGRDDLTTAQKLNLNTIADRQEKLIDLINERIADPETFYRTFLQDNEVTDSIFSDFESALSQGASPIDVDKIIETVKEKIFEDRDPGSFADRFAKAQVEAGVALTALELISGSSDALSTNIESFSREARLLLRQFPGVDQAFQSSFYSDVRRFDQLLRTNFEAEKNRLMVSSASTGQISNLIGWDQSLSDEERLALIGSVYRNGVVPDERTPEDDARLKAEVGTILQVKISRHVADFASGLQSRIMVYTGHYLNENQRNLTEILGNIQENGRAVYRSFNFEAATESARRSLQDFWSAISGSDDDSEGGEDRPRKAD